jgi:hypothetical protein
VFEAARSIEWDQLLERKDAASCPSATLLFSQVTPASFFLDRNWLKTAKKVFSGNNRKTPLCRSQSWELNPGPAHYE